MLQQMLDALGFSSGTQQKMLHALVTRSFLSAPVIELWEQRHEWAAIGFLAYSPPYFSALFSHRGTSIEHVSGHYKLKLPDSIDYHGNRIPNNFMACTDTYNFLLNRISNDFNVCINFNTAF